jgi:uncharacterized protein YecA (UPF0149 family)
MRSANGYRVDDGFSNAWMQSTATRIHSDAMTSPTAAPLGRNALCRCGSGRKYKHCCLAKDEAAAAVARAEAKAAAEAEAAGEPAETDTPVPTRTPRHQTEQPWKANTSRGFVSRNRTPRKIGGS